MAQFLETNALNFKKSKICCLVIFCNYKIITTWILSMWSFLPLHQWNTQRKSTKLIVFFVHHLQVNYFLVENCFLHIITNICCCFILLFVPITVFSTSNSNHQNVVKETQQQDLSQHTMHPNINCIPPLRFPLCFQKSAKNDHNMTKKIYVYIHRYIYVYI